MTPDIALAEQLHLGAVSNKQTYILKLEPFLPHVVTLPSR